MTDGATITVALDGKPRELAAGTTLGALVTEMGFAPGAVGTAVNGRFVPRTVREDTRLQAGDSIMLFQPIAGG